MPPLAPIPPAVRAQAGRSRGLWAGSVSADPVATGARGGRVRRWMYAAAGDAHGAVGAAVVDLGFVSTAFVWAWLGGEVVTWEARRPLRFGANVTSVPGGGAQWSGRDRVSITGEGGLSVDVTTAYGPLRAEIRAEPTSAATLVTDTAEGGWNCTEKAAGYPAVGTVACGATDRRIDGGGWRDWTAGRQDRNTTWRWAAGAGVASDGRRVGLNVSTGMNAQRAGEDVVWWDGTPYPLVVDRLAPASESEPAGAWALAGPGWGLELRPVGARAASEDLRLVASRYTQPVGRLAGTLPGPEGHPVEVSLAGVTEHHEARW